MDADYERENNPGGTRQCIFNGRRVVFCYGDEENARIYAVHLTTANQSEIRRAHLVSAAHEPKLWELRQIAAVDNLHKDLRMQDQIAEKVQVGSKKVIHIRKNDFKAKSDL